MCTINKSAHTKSLETYLMILVYKREREKEREGGGIREAAVVKSIHVFIILYFKTLKD